MNKHKSPKSKNEKLRKESTLPVDLRLLVLAEAFKPW